jgi:hypothetical protein
VQHSEADQMQLLGSKIQPYCSKLKHSLERRMLEQRLPLDGGSPIAWNRGPGARVLGLLSAAAKKVDVRGSSGRSYVVPLR